MLRMYAGGIAALIASCGATAESDCTSLYVEAYSQSLMVINLDAPCEFSEGFGLAFASSFSTNLPLYCGNPSTCLDADADVFVDYGTARVSALGCGSNGFAEARLGQRFLRTNLITRSVISRTCADCGSFTTAGGSASAFVVTDVNCAWSGSIDIDTEDDCNGGAPVGTLPTNYVVSYTGAGGQPVVDVFTAGCVPGTAPVCGSPQGATVPISGGAGPLVVGSIPFGPNGVWDYNDDGRINLLDILALQGDINAAPNGEIVLSGSSDPLAAYDLTGDGLLTLDDINRIGAVFSTFDQGVAGDDNGDLVTDCDDLAGVLAHQFDPALTICDPGYRIEFDVDLDGDNDSDDRAAILRTIQPADFNLDGDLDFFDVSGFLTAYNNQDPEGDFNGDGVFDFFDTSEFLDAYNNQACP